MNNEEGKMCGITNGIGIFMIFTSLLLFLVAISWLFATMWQLEGRSMIILLILSVPTLGLVLLLEMLFDVVLHYEKFVPVFICILIGCVVAFIGSGLSGICYSQMNNSSYLLPLTFYFF
jgi:hypothetical protein